MGFLCEKKKKKRRKNEEKEHHFFFAKLDLFIASWIKGKCGFAKISLLFFSPYTERTNYIERTITWRSKKYLCSGRCIKLLIFIVPHFPKKKKGNGERSVK
jgi:hypothetical protein